MPSTMFVFLVPFTLLLRVHADKLVPCYFVFGDSLVDNGNNNDRDTVAKANYPPYGMDYPGGPTGRFTNGRNAADFVAEALGFPDHVPPFAKANSGDFINGVNYASGGAGILKETGKQFGAVISLDEQLQNHQITIEKITSALGNADDAHKHLNQCLYYVGMGSNDYAAYATSVAKMTPELYASQLVNEYSRQLRDLYNDGARKVAIFGLGTIGCVPGSMMGRPAWPACLEMTKASSGIFNDKIKSLVDVFNKELAGAKFIYIDVFGIASSSENEFAVQNIPCCMFSEGMCAMGSPTCPDRTKYEYFDGVHPTEAAAEVVGKRAFAAASPSDAYPYDIQHLAQSA